MNDRVIGMVLAGVTALAFAMPFAVSATATAEIAEPRALACKLVKTVAGLQAISNKPSGSYCLGNDINLASVPNFSIPSFGGKFFGNGYTIRNLSGPSGLFGFVSGAVVQDVRLANVNITNTADFGKAGGLAGEVSGSTTITRVHVSGQVTCTGNECYAGGIVGRVSLGPVTLSESSSSAAITGPGSGVTVALVGGAVGQLADINGATVMRTVATGNVRCGATTCFAGGLLGTSFLGLVYRSSASGAVTVEAGGYAGGLIGFVDTTMVRRSHASGAVNGGVTADTGGLIGLVDDATIEESYSIGPVGAEAGANIGGLVGNITGMPTFTNVYWDRITSTQMTSAAGLQFSTAEFRAALPAGFGSAWAFTKNKSYPFLEDADIDLTLPLATLVSKKRVFTFLPIGQRDRWEYAVKPQHAGAASLAAVYTMIARAIGITRNVATLQGVKIDTYFWKDATQKATWKGPVTTRATLGTLTAISANVPLNTANVIGEMNAGNLVILRGVYNNNGVSTTHWMLGTLYTRDSDGTPAFVIAHDPWIGTQVMIDRTTKKVVWPANFPLKNFLINGYQPVTLN